MPNPIKGKRIILGITGSIAAYKAADLASKLTQVGAEVDVILTDAALKFITPLTFQSITGRKVFTDADLWGGEGHITHVALGRAGDLFVIAPASANSLAKLAHGMSDNLLCVAALAARCPVLIAPAMDAGMFNHPATQANVEILKQRGVYLMGPAAGHLASGLTGVGRMVEVTEILGHIRFLFGRNGPLMGKKVVVTAGGTQEPIDPVRFITNRSSGRQGFAIAQAALDAGAEVVLVAGSTNLESPIGIRRVDVRTAAEMHAAVLAEMNQAEVLVMAAAVADFRPIYTARQKIKKQQGPPEIKLENTIDILAAVAERRSQTGYPRRLVGFAAESQEVRQNAQSKLTAKHLDMIIANDITAPDAGFEVSTNRVTLVFADGLSESLPTLAKEEVGEIIIQKIISMEGLL
jgi:phosphopantothenoylcysteine decarboxylase/phosphopantothenate--cysteine ligase